VPAAYWGHLFETLLLLEPRGQVHVLVGRALLALLAVLVPVCFPVLVLGLVLGWVRAMTRVCLLHTGSTYSRRSRSWRFGDGFMSWSWTLSWARAPSWFGAWLMSKSWGER
jgi:hypothetical protein